MTTWTAPITFTSTTLTAAQMNTEVRDHANFLKGALDLITNSTTADTGTATYLSVVRAASTDTILLGRVTGDAQARLLVAASGTLTWGSGTVVGDATLSRNGASSLATDSALTITNNSGLVAIGTTTAQHAVRVYVTGDANPRLDITSDGGLTFGGGSGVGDTGLYRDAASTLKSQEGFWALGGIVTKTKAGVPADGDLVAGMQQSGAMVLDSTNSRIYFRVGTTWKYAALT